MTVPAPAGAPTTPTGPAGTRLATRVCPLCEATCGLLLTVEGDEVRSLRGDPDHVLSHGYLCPKAAALPHLDRDPDRLRAPLVRRDGALVETTWDDALGEVSRRLPPILAEHGRDAVAVFVGNPNVHNLAGQLYLPVLLRALGTHNTYSASTLDQMPKQVSAGLMFGAGLSVPIPDVDRTRLLVIIGANPLESNGSLMTAPDMRGRLRRLRERGGRLVVVDPRRTRTAEIADEHVFIRPGTDALLLAAMVTAVAEAGMVRVAPHVAGHLAGLDATLEALRPFTPERVAPACGVDAAVIRRLAAALVTDAPAAVYGRIGTCTQEFGTLASWLVDVLNTVTGNLDVEGGAMFPRAAAGARNTQGEPGRGRGMRFGRWRSRVRGLGEVFGELPSACLAEEIDTPGDGRIRALVTVAGNPVLSAPNAARLRAALPSLDLMVSVDVYRNETTRHADVVLPVPPALRRSHYDLAFTQLSVRDTATYSPAVLPPEPGMPDEWETLLRLAAVAMGMGVVEDVGPLDDMVCAQYVERESTLPGSALSGRETADVMAALAPRRGPERLLDLLLRAGPYGDAFGTRPGGLTLAALEEAPHGVDLGPMRPRIPEVLRTASGMVELAPQAILDDLPRLRAALDRDPATLVLIGRRDVRSNNSWMHNVGMLVRGPVRCTAQIHPEVAARAGVRDGDLVRLRSRVGAVEVPAEVTDAVMPGVVSVPHGWGHDDPEARMAVAAERPGANVNMLVDDGEVDPLSGNAVMNGVPVTLEVVGERGAA